MSRKGWTIAIFLLAFILLGLIDIGLNVLSLIPGVGPAFEGVTEGVLELMQAIVFAIGLWIVGSVEE